MSRWARGVLIGCWLLLASLSAVVGASDLPPMTLDEIERGQQGYGLSVFEGHEIERFDVEIIGVMRNQSPDTSFVLARLSGRDLETSGVIAGMSGSPVFVDERLVGAVAFSWPFSHEAIAGITPIAAMRRLNDASRAADRSETAARSHDGEAFPLPASVGVGSLEERLASLRLPDGTGESSPLEWSRFELSKRASIDEFFRSERMKFGALGPADGSSALQWTASGLSERAERLLGGALGELTPSGGVQTTGLSAGAVATTGSGQLLPGEAVAALLIDGDMRLAATGTVTDRLGDDVLGFGHPFLGLGPVEIPMATAEILTVLSSQYSSFKVSNVGPVVGAFDLDRAPGIHGTIGSEARTLPLKIALHGSPGDARPRMFEMQIARIPQLTPSLLGSAVVSAIDATTQVAGAQTVDIRLEVTFDDHPPLTIEQTFDGSSAAVSAAFFAMSVGGYLIETEFEAPRVEGVSLDLTQKPGPQSARLVGAHANRSTARAGDPVRLFLDLAAYRGETSRKTIDVTLPDDLAPGRYSLVVGDGATMDVVRQTVEQVVPGDFEQAFNYLSGLGSSRELTVLGLRPGRGLVFDGTALPELPGSIRSLWESAGTASALVPLRLAVLQEDVFPADRPIGGAVRVDLEIEAGRPQR